jgi:hypothetical protein
MPVVLFIYNNLQKALDIIGANDYYIDIRNRRKRLFNKSAKENKNE